MHRVTNPFMVDTLTLWLAASIHSLSFYDLVARLAMKMGGVGIRNQEQLKNPAFVSSIEKYVSQIWIKTGLCQALGQWFHGDKCFGRGSLHLVGVPHQL